MTTELDTVEACRPLRRDAVRNRALILEAAAQVFADRGLEAGYDEIARRAGVGVGTVYRRFPDRSELVDALFESRLQEIIAVAEEAAQQQDAWEGIVLFLHRTVEFQVNDRGLKEAMVLVSEARHHLVNRERLTPVLARLVARAHAEGVLRPEVEPNDLGVLLALLSSLATPEDPDLWRRYAALVLAGMRARPDQEPLPRCAPTAAVIHDLMLRRHRA